MFDVPAESETFVNYITEIISRLEQQTWTLIATSEENLAAPEVTPSPGDLHSRSCKSRFPPAYTSKSSYMSTPLRLKHFPNLSPSTLCLFLSSPSISVPTTTGECEVSPLHSKSHSNISPYLTSLDPFPPASPNSSFRSSESSPQLPSSSSSTTSAVSLASPIRLLRPKDSKSSYPLAYEEFDSFRCKEDSLDCQPFDKMNCGYLTQTQPGSLISPTAITKYRNVMEELRFMHNVMPNVSRGETANSFSLLSESSEISRIPLSPPRSSDSANDAPHERLEVQLQVHELFELAARLQNIAETRQRLVGRLAAEMDST